MFLQRRRLNARYVLAALAVSLTGLSGCGNDLDDAAVTPDLEAEVPDIRGVDDLDDSYRGLLDTRFVEDLPAYDTQEVTVLATVDEVFSLRSFTVTSPDDPEVGPVLVVTVEEAASVEPQAGQDLVLAATATNDFDAEVVAAELGLDLAREDFGEWDGSMFLLTTMIEPAG
ncbi:hypothetical protein [Blastococcus sp. LR1]|uniref:hypothetical protein n=1 Tax=Blastococcus sp. LR1 TaxID=2877000 RepID=UPI001CC94253|nr:hypothetical protein [Blastococcus sp. LR1]MCA0143798.1 hypothetical protein [Blastococcus sp. LR1]